ncbi:MAG: DUF1572 family protein [Planctomycetes bacterium]|nr:DUF1572 family protein [Planctomycetota bacterium]
MTARAFLDAAIARMGAIKQLGEGALAQASAPALFARSDESQNSMAVIVQHLCGNMLSRWTDFLTSDGEKPDRSRDAEFETVLTSPMQVMQAWQRGWDCTMTALRALGPDDVLKTVTIRAEPMTVLEAVIRQIAHYGYHVGQLVLLARQHTGPAFLSLSIPRGQSAKYVPRPRSSGIKE